MFQINDIGRCCARLTAAVLLLATGGDGAAEAAPDPSADAPQWRWLFDLDLPPQPLEPAPRYETRVIFDEGIGWALSKRGADETLRRIRQAGFNVYVPVVWHGRGAYYRSSVAHVEPRLAAVVADYDPLEYLIERAHALGIEVQPWFTVTRREDDRRPEFFDSGTPRDAYDIHRSNFRRFVVDLMTDVVRRYDVDGINLDYVRAMGVCVSDACQRQYRDATGGGLLLDYAERALNVEARTRLRAWQSAAVDGVVEPLAETVRKLKPDVCISADVYSPDDSVPTGLEGRDPIRWLRLGWIDHAFDMQYAPVLDVAALQRFRAAQPQPAAWTPVLSNYQDATGVVTPRPTAVVVRLVRLAQTQWRDAGVALYLYSMLSDEQIRALATGPFVQPARPQPCRVPT